MHILRISEYPDLIPNLDCTTVLLDCIQVNVAAVLVMMINKQAACSKALIYEMAMLFALRQVWKMTDTDGYFVLFHYFLS